MWKADVKFKLVLEFTNLFINIIIDWKSHMLNIVNIP